MDNYQIHHSSFADEGCIIGSGTKIWHFCHIMAGAIIGQNNNIGQNVVIMPGVVTGNFVKIQNNVSLYTGVICEDYVFIGPSVVFTNVLNPRSEFERKNEYQETIIHKGATIGANATIICGVSIGKYALIGAGSVITHPVPDFSLWVGNPGRPAGWVSRAGHKLVFGMNGDAICPQTSERYILKNNTVIQVEG